MNHPASCLRAREPPASCLRAREPYCFHLRAGTTRFMCARISFPSSCLRTRESPTVHTRGSHPLHIYAREPPVLCLCVRQSPAVYARVSHPSSCLRAREPSRFLRARARSSLSALQPCARAVDGIPTSKRRSVCHVITSLRERLRSDGTLPDVGRGGGSRDQD